MMALLTCVHQKHIIAVIFDYHLAFAGTYREKNQNFLKLIGTIKRLSVHFLRESLLSISPSFDHIFIMVI